MRRRHAFRTYRPTGRLARLVAFVAALVLLLPAAASALPIEDFAGYEPQTNCSPNAKPGTLRLSQWLLKQYPGSGSLGISRSCKDGGVSEHKEGRAFDWAVDVNSTRDRGYVNAFFARILAADADGNPAALARRMGIMYLIWNDHIYSSYYGFAARDYRGCKVLAGCSATLRHRNHVHISLSRAGGNGTTSWYTGTTTTTPPAVPLIPKTSTGVLDLSRRPFVTVAIGADGRPRNTGFKLRRGTAYTITAAGLYGYGSPGRVADASCRWATSTRTWVPKPTRGDARAHGSLDLLVNRRPMSATTCRASHVYARTVTPRRTARLRLQVANKPTGAVGSLTILVARKGTDVSAGLPQPPVLTPAPTTADAQEGTGLVTETVPVPAGAGTAISTGSLQEGASYRVTVDGSAALGGGVRTDGRCLLQDGTWWAQASLDRRFPDQTHGRLYVDGVPFTGTPTAGGPVCGTRTHSMTWTATRSGRLELALWDPLTRTDDSGELTVRVQRLTPLATPVAAPAETPAATAAWTQRTDTVAVDPSAPSGAVSVMRVRTGQTVTLVVRGTHSSGRSDADAACVLVDGTWTGSDPAVLLGQEPLELWADGQRVPWRPVTGTSACAGDHVYTATYTAQRNGPLRFAVLDADYRDNAGSLAVSLSR
jgi:hypothetical protein